MVFTARFAASSFGVDIEVIEELAEQMEPEDGRLGVIDRVLREDAAKLADADHVGQLLDLDHPSGAIGHAVAVTADGDEAVVADPALELEPYSLRVGLRGGALS